MKKATSTTSTIACAALAVLMGAPSPAAAKAASADGAIRLAVESGKPLMLAGGRRAEGGASKPTRNYVKVGLTGQRADAVARVPINLALVLDRSGSMRGAKMREAKEAARLVIERLSSDDIISIVTYDSGVQVLVPATKAVDKRALYDVVSRIQPGGSTALFAGVSTGIAEVRKFLDRQRVNRVILLSDGQANVGPSSPNELALLGASANKEGVSVTTIGLGLGYNEDLMARLAQASDGNHAFAEAAGGLAKIFELELGDVMSVVAQEVSLKVTLPEGVRPIQLLNRDGDIHGQEVFVSFNQLYGGQEKYVLLEVEVTPGSAGERQLLGRADVSYAAMPDGRTARLTQSTSIGFTESPRAVAKAENRAVMVEAVEALAVRINREAVALRDKGNVKAARQKLNDNAAFLQSNAQRYESPRLQNYSTSNSLDAKNLEGRNWKVRRKKMRKTQHELETQQSY